MHIDQLSATDLATQLETLQEQYKALHGQNLALDLTRGKPGTEQLALSNALDGILAGDYCRKVSGKRDSNPRPSAWEADALPTELFPRPRNNNTDRFTRLSSSVIAKARDFRILSFLCILRF